MTDPYFQNLFAERIGGANYGKDTKIYKFEKIKRAKRWAVAEFPDRQVLDFGIGENDEMADASVRQVLSEQASVPENRGYADNGVQEYKDAAAAWMKREFNVEINPNTEVNHSLGCKSALAIIPGVFINPGDITLMTVPGYPVAGSHTKFYGGEVYELPLKKENNFLPDLASIPDEVAKRAKLLIINYPNSPTGALATTKFYEDVVKFAKKHEIVVVQDATHAMLSFGQKPTSFLQIEGAKDVGIEAHSMSKGYNMIGWRMGFVVGNEKIVRAFADFKDNCDSGQFIPVQLAAAAALNNEKIAAEVKTKYERRLQKLVATLQQTGAKAEMPGGTFFLYINAPKSGNNKKETFTNAEEATDFLIRQQSIITVPWDNAGSFLRFSATYPAKNEKEEDSIMQDLKERLMSLNIEW